MAQYDCYRGSNLVTGIYRGSTPVTQICKGGELVYSKIKPNARVFDTYSAGSGTFTPPVRGYYRIMLQAGGGGGGAAGDGPRDYKACEGGGGSGSYVDGIWWLEAQAYSYTIGDGGNGAGGLYTTVRGATGGDSTFGSLITTYGGVGGYARWTDGSGGAPAGGAGGATPYVDGNQYQLIYCGAGATGGAHSGAGTANGGNLHNWTTGGKGGDAYSAGYTATGYKGNAGFLMIDYKGHDPRLFK